MTSNQWKKQINVLLCLLLVLLFAGCKSSFSKSKYGTKVINNIKQHDSNAIFEMFAPAYQEESSFKADLFAFLDALYGLNISFENATISDGASAKDYDNGKLTYYDDSVVYRNVVDDSGNKYLLNIYFTQTDTKHPENVGLQSLDLVLKNEDGSSKSVTFIGRDNSSDLLYCYDVLNIEL